MEKRKYWFINIVAMSTNCVIGKDNKLPWKLKEDLKEFSRSIKNSILVMGKNTCNSLPRKQNDQPNYVLTTDKTYYNEGYHIVHSIDELLEKIPRDKPIYVIGGQSLYRQIIELSDREDVVLTNEITIVDKEVEGDAFFPIELLETRGYKRILRKSCIESDRTVWDKYIYYKG